MFAAAIFFTVLLVGGGVALAVASGERALTDDCKTNRLAAMTPDELNKWLEKHFAPAMAKALSGQGAIKVVAVAGETVPQYVRDDIDATRAAMAEAGRDAEAINAVARYGDDYAVFPVDGSDQNQVAMYLYQQIAASCPTKIKNWAGEPQYVWPSVAAECFHDQLVAAVSVELHARTGDRRYQVTATQLAQIASLCAVAGESGSGGGNGQQGARGLGVSIAGHLDTRRMAADANAGRLHPASILTGSVFR